MKPFEVGERVTWKIQDHGKEKKLIGKIASIRGTYADVEINGTGKTVSTTLGRLNRCRGRKPGTSALLP